MKSIVLVLIIVVTVNAVDKPRKRQSESGMKNVPDELLEESPELEDKTQQEGDEVDSHKIFREAFDAMLAHRCKRNTVEQTEKKRLIEIDELVGKLWADKEKRANNGEAAAGTSITEQKEEENTEQEVKTPKKTVSHPQFENTPEYTHDRRKLERNKHERKNKKKGNRKTAIVVQDEVHSDEHFVDAEKPTDTKPVITETEEKKHHKTENRKKKITKHNESEESSEHLDSTESIAEDSPSTKSRKVSAPVEPVTEQSEPATDVPEESFISDSASPDPAADLAPVAFEDLPPVAAATLTPVSTEDSAPVDSTDSAPADPTTVASTGASDDAAHEEMTISLSKAINLGQARPKRQDTTAESKTNKKAEQQVQRKLTVAPDRFAANAESSDPREEQSLIELENKTSEEDRVSQKHGSSKKTTHHDGKEGEEKKVNPQKKDDEQPVHTVGNRRVSVRTRQNGGVNVRPHLRVTDKEPPVSTTSGERNAGSGEGIRAKNPQIKYNSMYFFTSSPINIKNGTKKASAASSHDGVRNKGRRPAAREAQASLSPAKPAA